MKKIGLLLLTALVTGCGTTGAQQTLAQQKAAYMEMVEQQKAKYSKSIDEWPSQQKVDLAPFESRFKDLYAVQPKTIPVMTPPLIKCNLPEARARLLTNTNDETIEEKFKSLTPPGIKIEREISVIVIKADVSSTEVGCLALQTAELNTQTYPSFFRLPESFKEPVALDVQYELHMTTIMDIGGEVVRNKTVSETTTIALIHRPLTPANPQYPIEALVIVPDPGRGSTLYIAGFKRLGKINGVVNEIVMSSTDVTGKTQNWISLGEYNPQGQLAISTYSENGLISTVVNGKRELKGQYAKLNTAPAQQKESNIALNQKREKLKALQASAKCKLANDNWAYTGDACKEGLAHGKGSSVDMNGLKFVGLFEAGNRVKGEIHQNGEMIFSGELEDDKPNGNAICLHEGEYEECRFFKGKRIDALYKMRKENAKLKEEMTAMKQEQQQQLQQQLANQNRQVVREKTMGDYAADAIKKEGMERAADFLFDKLF